MSEQEIKQNEIMEELFANIDSDGSGSLDLNELVDLFRQNKIHLCKEIIREMFSGNEFTLEKFKAIAGSESGLSQFKQIIK